MFNANKGLKLKELTIEDYKLFQNFNISFTDVQGNPLPIIVIAGINGTGKTTILEYIKQEYSDVVYFSANENLKNIKEFLPQYLFQKIFNEKADVEQTYKKVRDYINTIFKDLKMKIEFDGRDGEGNLFFRNKKGKVFSIDEISTGEKTLLSKVLYLYVKEIKDSVILIDEPELSLHPAWQNRVLKLYENFAKENNCQIIIATHSPHIIGSAKNEYIRILTEDGVINDILAYGRDIEWVLEEVMGASYTREKAILDKFSEIQELINKSQFSIAEKELDLLENVIGENDSEILKLRNDLAFERIDFEED